MIRLFIILAIASYAPKQQCTCFGPADSDASLCGCDDVEQLMSPADAELVVAHEMADGKLVRMVHRI